MVQLYLLLDRHDYADKTVKVLTSLRGTYTLVALGALALFNASQWSMLPAHHSTHGHSSSVPHNVSQEVHVVSTTQCVSGSACCTSSQCPSAVSLICRQMNHEGNWFWCVSTVVHMF